jgi:hypothetical protein
VNDCGDGVDNDQDGLTDFAGGDPGCSNAADASERGTAVCDDGLDNDNDGRTDFAPGAEQPMHVGDPGCESLADTTETNQAIECDDGIDNDNDQLIDFRNPMSPGPPGDGQCTSRTDTSESS